MCSCSALERNHTDAKSNDLGAGESGAGTHLQQCLLKPLMSTQYQLSQHKNVGELRCVLPDLGLKHLGVFAVLKQRLHQLTWWQWWESNDPFGSKHLGLGFHLLDLCVVDFLHEAIFRI